MIFITAKLTPDQISLETDKSFSRLLISYGKTLENRYELTNLATTSKTITKENMNLNTLDNSYFRIEVFDEEENTAAVGLYNIDVTNNREAVSYDVNKLKQDLDNLNYYDGVLQSINEKLDFMAANDTFFNYLDYLENKLYANNFLDSIGK